MKIYMINKSSVLSDDEVKSWVPAFHKFCGHVTRWWPRSVDLVYEDKAHEPLLAWKVIIADSSDQAGALGYHDFTPDGRPISYVFAADDEKYGYSPTVTATHEIAEMIADPWISQLFQVSEKMFYAQEIADPCEADQFGYEIDGVKVSDFVTPAYFIPGSDKQILDHTEHIEQPLDLLPGGYMSVYSPDKGWTQIYAQKDTGKLVLAEKEKPSQYSRLHRYGRKRDNDGVQRVYSVIWGTGADS